jgi:hypothetical protein
LNNNNVVDRDSLAWCNPCEQPHDQDTCLIINKAFQQASEVSKEGSNGTETNNYVGEWFDTINNIYNLSDEQMKKIKDKSIDASTIAKALAPKPSQEKIKRRILEKAWITYKRKGKPIQQYHNSPPHQPQGVPIQQPQVAPREISQLSQ